MILNRTRLLIGTCISRISGVEHGEAAGTMTGSEQSVAPYSSAYTWVSSAMAAHNTIDQDSVSVGRCRGLLGQVGRTESDHSSSHLDSLRAKRGPR